MILHIVSFFALTPAIPLEVYDDRKGETKKEKAIDLIWRGGIMLLGALINTLLVGKSFWASLDLAVALHFFIFDYWVAAELYRNGIGRRSWFEYIGKTSWMDDFPLWSRLTPAWRFAVRLLVLAQALIFYF